MFQVGLTGGIGSGKTLVCSVLEKMGVAVYYADQEARKLMNSDPGLISQIEKLFGREAFRSGTLNRQYIAGKVFGDPELLAKLNEVVHPAVRKDYRSWVEMQSKASYVVEEAAILFESGANRDMDFTVLVYAPQNLRMQRVLERDGLSEQQVLSRMGTQISEEEKRKRVDFVVTNDGTEMLLPQIVKMHSEILNRV